MLTLSERINLRTSAETKNLLARAASLRGMSLSNFLLEAAQQLAQEVVKEHEQILLSSKDWKRFALILDDDSPPNAKLQKAMTKFKAAQS